MLPPFHIGHEKQVHRHELRGCQALDLPAARLLETDTVDPVEHEPVAQRPLYDSGRRGLIDVTGLVQDTDLDHETVAESLFTAAQHIQGVAVLIEDQPVQVLETRYVVEGYGGDRQRREDGGTRDEASGELILRTRFEHAAEVSIQARMQPGRLSVAQDRMPE